MPVRAAVLVAALILTGCAAGGARAEPGPVGPIAVSVAHCAPGWVAQKAGRQHYTLHNTSRSTLQVTLIDAGRGAIYGQVRQLAAGTSRPLQPLVPKGSYRWRCVPLRGTSSVSAVRRVQGPGGTAARPLIPLSAEEINGASAEYSAAVVAGLGRLVVDTDRLATAVRSGDRASARTRWLTAHLDYERLGAAYGTFGDLDGAIDGRPDGLPRGVHDPSFAGFRRLEYGLWHGQPAAVLRPVADRLDGDVHTLTRTFIEHAVVAADIPLRAHEILENTLQFELTGRTDQGSHTNLLTARANLDGTRLVLHSLVRPLRIRDPGLLAAAEAGLTRLAAALDADRGRTLAGLGTVGRQRLDALTGALLEKLALIPDVLPMPPSTAPS